MPGVEPDDEGFRILPVQAYGRPERRLDIGRRGRQTAADPLPAQAQHLVAGPGLITGGIQEGEKLRAGDRDTFPSAKAFTVTACCGPSESKPARLARRTAHQEFARRNAHHLGTFGAFLEFTGLKFVLALGAQKQDGGQHEGRCATTSCPHRSRNAAGRNVFRVKERRDHDPQAGFRRIPAIFRQEKPEDGQAPQSGHFPEPQGGGKT